MVASATRNGSLHLIFILFLSLGAGDPPGLGPALPGCGNGSKKHKTFRVTAALGNHPYPPLHFRGSESEGQTAQEPEALLFFSGAPSTGAESKNSKGFMKPEDLSTHLAAPEAPPASLSPTSEHPLL